LNFDQIISTWVRETFPTSEIRKILGKVNRGEVFFVILLPFFWFSETFVPFGWALCYLGFLTFLTDRTVFLLKRLISRRRPLLSLAGKIDSNPDMRYSFPSAHAANSMVVVVILIFSFSFSPWFFLFPVLAGIGRILSLHHYPSDVLGGWILGGIFGSLGSLSWHFFRNSEIFF